MEVKKEICTSNAAWYALKVMTYVVSIPAQLIVIIFLFQFSQEEQIRSLFVITVLAVFGYLIFIKTKKPIVKLTNTGIISESLLSQIGVDTIAWSDLEKPFVTKIKNKNWIGFKLRDTASVKFKILHKLFVSDSVLIPPLFDDPSGNNTLSFIEEIMP